MHFLNKMLFMKYMLFFPVLCDYLSEHSISMVAVKIYFSGKSSTSKNHRVIVSFVQMTDFRNEYPRRSAMTGKILPCLTMLIN